MTRLRLKIALIIAFSILSLSACSQDVIKETVRLKTVDGKVITLPSKKNQWIVLNFWASWCKPCRDEIPALNKIYQAHHDILIVGVNVENYSNKVLKNIMKNLDIQYPVLPDDPSGILNLPIRRGIPATYILSPAGKWLNPLYGEQTERSILNAIGK